MIIGTAGHIDHGKSALVEALTGHRVDRLAEERSRGITIDLNFAPLELDGGLTAGVVDVPGHEDFVRTMVAGAAGMDLVLLVIAADEGIMPQTREHLAILEALGVPRGIPVLTKCDLAEPAWVELVREEVDGWLTTSSVSFVPAVPVSAKAGTGLEALRALLQAESSASRARDATAPFRMPIDRAFSMAGTGTVVTGSVWSGSLSVGDQARVLPSDIAVRVRTMETHGRRVASVTGGSRAALGLAGIDRDTVQRGDALVDAALPWEATSVIDVQLDLHPHAPRPLTARTRVHLHLGTAEVIARVSPRTPIVPGGGGLARLSTEEPIVARGGDRFVIRSYSPVTTIGGGRVLDPLPPRRRAAWPAGLDSEDTTSRLHALMARQPPGAATGSLALRSGLTPAEVEALLTADGTVRRVDGGWVLSSAVAAVGERALEALRAYHREHPALPGLPVETMRRMVDRSVLLAETAVSDLAMTGELVVEAGVARLPGFKARIAGGETAVEQVVEFVRAAGLEVPPLPELERQLERMDVPGAVRLAVREGRLQAITRDWYVSLEALDGFRNVLAEIGSAGDVTVAAVRDRTGLSRKYLIPLLEWADREGITRRDGAARRLT